MTKDFAKKEFIEKRGSRAEIRIALIFSLTILIICVISFVIYEYRHNQAYLKNLPTLARIRNWFKKGEGELDQGLTTVKNLATNKNEEEQEIHFEFYNVLPNMQVSVAKPAEQDDRPVGLALHTRDNQRIATPSSSRTLVSVAHFFNSSDLEKEFADRLKKNFYIIQIGSFKTEAAAFRMRQALIRSGVEGKIISVESSEKDANYRLQAGPFSNKTEMRAVQRQLQKQGITGIVRKLSAVN